MRKPVDEALYLKLVGHPVVDAYQLQRDAAARANPSGPARSSAGAELPASFRVKAVVFDLIGDLCGLPKALMTLQVSVIHPECLTCACV